jgi:hypothetical protein
MLFKSKIGEIKTKKEWQYEVDDFWAFAERQNKHICSSGALTNKRLFKKPSDAFERYARIIGLQQLEDSECVNG